MRFVFAVLALALSSCHGADREAVAAEQQYEMVKASGGSDEEQCRELQRVTEAWLRAGDQEKYQHWRLIRDIHCETMRLRRQNDARY